MAHGRKRVGRLTSTLVWKVRQSGRKIAHGVDIINTRRSAGTDVIMPDTAQSNYFSLSDK